MKVTGALVLTLTLVPAAALAQDEVNPIHPTFVPLDAAGRPATASDQVSSEATCGGCHDVRYVAEHDDHARHGTGATCIQCHVEGGRLDVGSRTASGELTRDAIRIGSPRSERCASCHGVIAAGGEPVEVPADFEAMPAGSRNWSLTRAEGAVVAAARVNESFLNVAGKAELATPWDVHSAKLVQCVACHYSSTNPERTDGKRTRLDYVPNDPRRRSIAEFLRRPDHRLAAASCTSCHDAGAGHDFLPYRSRHMQVVACETCHVPALLAPTAAMVDSTVVTKAGAPVVVYRNVDRQPGETLNSATVRPLVPLLTERVDAGGARKVTPVNLVSRWRWVSRASGKDVPPETVARAYLEDGKYRPELMQALDRDHDGSLSDAELRLETKSQVALVADRLRALGVEEPVIDGTIDTYPIEHGIAARERALRECDACHGAASRLAGEYPVTPYLPGGVSPRPGTGNGIGIAQHLVPTSGGGLAFEADGGRGALHVLGYTRDGWTNVVGLLVFAAVFFGVAVHGLVRLALRGRNGRSLGRAESVYTFGRYERLWHWTMALSGVGLILTGLVVHAPTWPYWPLSLATAVAVHNVLAAVLVVNAFLALFYHVTTLAVRNFIPEPHGLLARILEHVEYQTRGIFRGAPEPGHGHKLNPLQQLTYLSLLNVLFPLQIVTGALVWMVGYSPRVAAAVGGLHVVGPLHNLGAWLFLSFFVLHAYLVTTGRTVGEHVRSMITGYRSVEPDADAQEA